MADITVPFWTVVLGLMITTGLLVASLGAFATDAAARARIRNRNALAVAERRDARPWNRLDAALKRTDAGAGLDSYLIGAGLSIKPLTFVVLAVAVAGAAYVITRSVLPVWLAVPAAPLAVYGLTRWVERRRRKRRELFIQQLPDVARLVSNGSKAGLSLLSAVELAAEDLDEPAGSELELVASKVRLGESFDRSLLSMSERLPSRDVAVLVSTMVIQQRTGGDVVEALNDLAQTLESRRNTAREVRLMLVGAIFTSYVIPFLVLGLLLLLNLTSPGALDEMVSTLFGRVVLILAGIMTMIGYAMIRRITRTDT